MRNGSGMRQGGRGFRLGLSDERTWWNRYWQFPGLDVDAADYS